MKKKALGWLFIIMLLGYPIAYFMGAASQTPLFKVADDAAEHISKELSETGKKLEKALDKIASQESIIQKYEAREQYNAAVIRIRDIDVQLFKEVTVKITSNQEYPWSIFSDKYQLNPEIFGNFIEISDNLNVTYYYGAVGNKIEIENVNDKFVNISYSKRSFINPYQINSRNVKLNLGAKVMTTMENDEIYDLVNTVGQNQLSNIEDEFINQIKKEYKSSNIPIYVNGIPLENWSNENKVFTKEDIDPEYTISVQNK